MIRSTLFTTVFCLLTPLAQAQMAPGTGMEMDDEAYEAMNELQTTGQKANLPVEAEAGHREYALSQKLLSVLDDTGACVKRKFLLSYFLFKILSYRVRSFNNLTASFTSASLRSPKRTRPSS